MYIHRIMVNALLLLCFILGSQGTIIGRYFKRIYLFSVSPYLEHVLETKYNVRNKIWCGTYCMQERCVCASFVYDTSTKICTMYTQQLVASYGGIIGYTKNTGCALTTPSIANADLLTYSTCAVTFGCPYGFEMIGEPLIQCQADEEWTQTTTICKIITCPDPESDMGKFPTVIKLVRIEGNTVGSYAVYKNNFFKCLYRICQIDKSWSDLQKTSGLSFTC